MTAFGYVRKSVMVDAAKTLSPQLQADRISALAKAHGDADITILEDLDISGAKVEERPEYMRLVEAIESGEAHAVYAYDLSRLHRNTKEALRFFELAEKKHVTVSLVEGNIDTRGPTGTLVLTILAAMNAWTSQVTSAKLVATFAMKRARGDTNIGGRPYGSRIGEDASAVVNAYRETKSFTLTARRLNTDGVSTRNDATRGWSWSAVRSVVRRLAPELITEQTSGSVRGSSNGDRLHRFARLLRCGMCDGILTPSSDYTHVDSYGHPYTRYYCSNANTMPHGRSTVAESMLVPAVKAEADHALLLIHRMSRGSADDTAALAELAAKRERVIESCISGLITKASRDERLAVIAAEEAKLTAVRYVRRITVPVDVADADATKVNAYLRRLFDHATVDMSKPASRGDAPAMTFTWRDESLRAEVVDDGETS
jgi:DNA invertase Pin-like site-specific DNA recombinase